MVPKQKKDGPDGTLILLAQLGGYKFGIPAKIMLEVGAQDNQQKCSEIEMVLI
jgi:hypothetical protein